MPVVRTPLKALALPCGGGLQPRAASRTLGQVFPLRSPPTAAAADGLCRPAPKPGVGNEPPREEACRHLPRAAVLHFSCA